MTVHVLDIILRMLPCTGLSWDQRHRNARVWSQTKPFPLEKGPVFLGTILLPSCSIHGCPGMSGIRPPFRGQFPIEVARGFVLIKFKENQVGDVMYWHDRWDRHLDAQKDPNKTATPGQSMVCVCVAMYVCVNRTFHLFHQSSLSTVPLTLMVKNGTHQPVHVLWGNQSLKKRLCRYVGCFLQNGMTWHEFHLMRSVDALGPVQRALGGLP